MLFLCCLVIVAALAADPRSVTGAVIRRWLVEKPAAALDRLSAGQIVLYAGLGLFGLFLVAAFQTDGMRLFGFMLPETLAWFAAFDVALFVDALLIAATVTMSRAVTVVRHRVSEAGRSVRLVVRKTASRARRTPSRPRPRLPTDGDGPRCGGVYAFG